MANALELHLSCINPSIWPHITKLKMGYVVMPVRMLLTWNLMITADVQCYDWLRYEFLSHNIIPNGRNDFMKYRINILPSNCHCSLQRNGPYEPNNCNNSKQTWCIHIKACSLYADWPIDDRSLTRHQWYIALKYPVWGCPICILWGRGPGRIWAPLAVVRCGWPVLWANLCLHWV